MSEDIFDRINEINNKADFLTFLSMLKNDFSLHKSEWENTTIEEYFQAIQSWIEDYSSSSFKGVALKNPIRGFAPEPHELFEKSSTKTFFGSLRSDFFFTVRKKSFGVVILSTKKSHTFQERVCDKFISG